MRSCCCSSAICARRARTSAPCSQRCCICPTHVHIAVAGFLPGSPYPDEARALGIADRVHFLGLVKDMPVLMHSVDAFVFPSRYEAMSLSLLEAMAAGLAGGDGAHGGRRGDHHAGMRHRARRSGRSRSAGRRDRPSLPTSDAARRAMGIAANELATGFGWARMARAIHRAVSATCGQQKIAGAAKRQRRRSPRPTR